MRKLGGLALALLVLAIVVMAFRAPLSMAILRRGVERAMTADVIGELPDGLHVALCGAGGPLPDPVRSGPCVAVIAGESLFVFDAGSGGARNLGRMQLPIGKVQALFLTHFHSDHIDGLGELAMLRWAQGGNASPLPVVGPAGVEDVIAGFNQAYQQDAVYRVAHHGEATVPSTGNGMTPRPFVQPTEGAPAVVWDGDGVQITAFRVDHFPIDPAVGYRIDYGGRSVVVSGDTKKSAELERMAQQADLLVHEALASHMIGQAQTIAEANDRPILAKILSDIPDYHTTPVEVAEIARDAKVGHLLYYHIVPALPIPGLEATWLEGVSDAWDGDYTVGRDRTLISLPRESQRIDVGKL
jgi:ribonuclease Z